MTPQRDTYVKLSFQMWLDHYLMSKSMAFSTGQYPLYYINDDQLPSGYKSYSSPFKQWVWDSSLSGVVIPSGIMSGSSFLPNDGENVILDYENGRAIVKTNNTNENYSTSFSYKDFNIYATAQTEEELLIENKFSVNSRFYYPQTGIAPHKPVAPAIFFKFNSSDSKGFSIGGEDNTTYRINATIVCESQYYLDNVSSLLRDAVKRPVPLITGIFRSDDGGASYPFGPNWDVQNGGFDYVQRVLIPFKNGELEHIYITSSKTSALSSRIIENMDLSSYVGFVNLDISDVRYPRI